MEDDKYFVELAVIALSETLASAVEELNSIPEQSPHAVRELPGVDRLLRLSSTLLIDDARQVVGDCRRVYSANERRKASDVLAATQAFLNLRRGLRACTYQPLRLWMEKWSPAMLPMFLFASSLAERLGENAGPLLAVAHGADDISMDAEVAAAINRMRSLVQKGRRKTPADDDDFQPSQWFGKKISSRLRKAASLRRKNKRVRSKTVNGVKLYHVGDARRWWPMDVPH